MWNLERSLEPGTAISFCTDNSSRLTRQLEFTEPVYPLGGLANSAKKSPGEGSLAPGLWPGFVLAHSESQLSRHRVGPTLGWASLNRHVYGPRQPVY